MTQDVKVPRLAESISEAVLVAWLKQDGEAVRTDEPIATLETDKAAVEIPADAAGVLHHARAIGDRVEVGDVIARIEVGQAPAATSSPPAAAAAPAQPAPPKPASAPPPAPPAPAPRPAAATPPAPAPAPKSRPSAANGEEPAHGPAVRRMAEEHGVDLGAVPGTGPGGRVLKEDVQRYLESAPKTSAPAAPPAQRPPASAPAPPAPAAPPAQPAPARATPLPSGAAKPGASAPWLDGEAERAVPMSRIRQRIAERLVQAQHTAAILTTFNEVDMTEVIALRTRFKESFEQRHGVKLSFMSFFGRACVLALQQIPEINAEVRGADIVYKRSVHLGVAVQTERGLVVPVVHDADRRSFADLEREIARLAAGAREQRLTLDELGGGTFTVSNGGVFGSLLSTPILNPPQSGILGMHKIEKRPVVVDDQIVIRPMMYLALSYDHRIVDGEQAVTFLVSVKERLEDPERMLIEV